jgi:hypothetical protein
MVCLFGFLPCLLRALALEVWAAEKDADCGAANGSEKRNDAAQAKH